MAQKCLEQFSNKSSYRNKVTHMWVEDNILFGVYEEKAEVTVELAVDSVSGRLKIQDGRNLPMFIDISKVKSFEKGVRDYLGCGDGVKLVKACAIICNSQKTQFIANAFLLINKPPRPTKIFSNRDKALKWLENFRD